MRVLITDFIIDIKIAPLEEGVYLALSDDLLAEGRNYQETFEIDHDVARKIIESCIEHNAPLPINIQKQISKTQRKAKLSIDR